MKKRYEIDLNKQLTFLLTIFWLVNWFTHFTPYREVTSDFITDGTDLFEDFEGLDVPRKIEILSRNNLAGMTISVAGMLVTSFLTYLNKTGTKLYLIPKKPFFKKKNIRVERG